MEGDLELFESYTIKLEAPNPRMENKENLKYPGKQFRVRDYMRDHEQIGSAPAVSLRFVG
ncbi:MAG: hypothetical protein DME65_13870 [Verrucomicrobia bacterium]|nr:MAG: hypothetical protein DME65_13870 [Verrucomicrobiota bacterium]